MVQLSASYVAAREIGAEVELLCAVEDPTKAMPLPERVDQVFAGYSPYLLVNSPVIAIFLLSWAFPGLTRKRKS